MHIDPADHEWWRRAVFYQIYPRSFQDSNGDGIGDLPGIIGRLGYLQSLGIDAIWISPTFPSPMKDFGYDVSDYQDVHPIFGTLDDMDRLIAEAHARGIRVLLDYVPNHSSDQHPWFIESRSSRDNPKRDWYYWRDAKPDGSPPNNWRSVFGGPAWTWDEATGQYYLHSFLKEQPDLNWRNPDVVEAMHDVLRFWLRRGVDGFRIDVMHMVLKHPDLADNPPNPAWQIGMRDSLQHIWANNSNYPDVTLAVAGIRKVLNEFPGAMAVGEAWGTAEEVARFYGDDGAPGLHLTFNFHFIGSRAKSMRWEAANIRQIIDNSESSLPEHAWPCYAFSNHDRERIVTRYGGDGRGIDRARAAALLLLGLRGTPFIYYGDEIGMEDVPIPPEKGQDPSRFNWENRDPERTPMQWDATEGRGFTVGEPWLPFGEATINVEDQRGKPNSMLSLYRRAIEIRRAQDSLKVGTLELLESGDEDVVAFVRAIDGASPVLVAVNSSKESRKVDLPMGMSGQLLLASAGPQGPFALPASTLTLPPLGAAWVELTS